MKTLFTIFLFVVSYAGFSQQLSYEPINPAFGGNTFNYTWLLNSANSQNSFTDPALDDSREDESTLEQFSEGLNRQLLSQLTRTLFSSQLGEGLQEGTFTFGTLSLDIFDSAEGLVVNILDTVTGEQTQIIVP